MPSELRVTIRPEGQATVLALGGELDLASHARLEHAIDRVLESAPELVVLDLERLEFIDIAGLRSVVRSSQQLRGAGRRMAVAAPSRTVTRLLALTQLDEAPPVFGTVEEALEGGRAI